MPYFEKDNLRLYYEDVGEGEPIITNHGLMEDANYWSETGVTAKLAENYRVISMDMRGHGRTVIDGEPHGCDADTMAKDFDDLADYLGLDKFHMLTHATGGMVGARYGMSRSERLISLMLIDTSSNTEVEQVDYRERTEEEIAEQKKNTKMWEEATEEVRENYMKAMREADLKMTVEARMAGIRREPGSFLFKMAEHPDGERMLKIYEGFLRRADRQAVQIFMANFYSDPSPRIEG
ncbi:MAG: alpha/beta fold hydrolase, partial [Promethearchaeota archaeon]